MKTTRRKSGTIFDAVSNFFVHGTVTIGTNCMFCDTTRVDAVVATAAMMMMIIIRLIGGEISDICATPCSTFFNHWILRRRLTAATASGIARGEQAR